MAAVFLCLCCGLVGGRAQKNRLGRPGGFDRDVGAKPRTSLEFDFFVFHVFPSFGIKFHDQHFLGGGFFVFGCGVEVTGAGSGFQLDLLASAFGCHGAVL
jgi:hypothetical protein